MNIEEPIPTQAEPIPTVKDPIPTQAEPVPTHKSFKDLTLGDLKHAVDTGDFSKFPSYPKENCRKCFGRGCTGWRHGKKISPTEYEKWPEPCKCIMKIASY